MKQIFWSLEQFSLIILNFAQNFQNILQFFFSQGGHSIFSKNSRTNQEHFKNILPLFKNTIKRPEK